MSFGEILSLLSRWFHVLSAMLIVGGAYFGGFASQGNISDEAAHRFRRLSFLLLLIFLATGIYNFFQKTGPLTTTYHALFGLKVLLALHVWIATMRATKPDTPPADRMRRFKSAVVSGLIVALLGAVLRAITL